MFSFIIGLLFGAGGMYYGSEKVRENLQFSVIASQALWQNKELLNEHVKMKILEMKRNGTLEQFIYGDGDKVIDLSNIPMNIVSR